MENEIKKLSSKNLADYIAAYRVLKIGKENVVACMQELVRRRSEGDNYNYEEQIEVMMKQLIEAQNNQSIN